jgi:hypothetical protein
MPHISQVTFDPLYPNITEPTGIEFKGWAPFACGELDVTVADPSHVAIVVTQVPGCGDTTQTWMTRFTLGMLPLGSHELNVALRFAAHDSVVDLAGVLPFHVYGTPSGPPPPEPGPPTDSLQATLSAARPNPFATESVFGVSLEDPARAEIAVFDVNGRRVATLFEGVLPRGTSRFAWDGRLRNGTRAAGGVYFYRLILPERTMTRRLVLLGAP